MEKKYCIWSNSCGKTVCCALCKQAKCDERCNDDNLTCKYAIAEEMPKISVKTVPTTTQLKKWDKDKIKE